MEQPKTCPSPGALEDFLLGNLHDDQIDAIGEHLAVCRRCQMVVAQPGFGTDALLAPLRRHDATGQVFAVRSPRSSVGMNSPMAVRPDRRIMVLPRTPGQGGDKARVKRAVSGRTQRRIGAFERYIARHRPRLHRRAPVAAWLRAYSTSVVTHLLVLILLALVTIPAVILQPAAISIVLNTVHAGDDGLMTLQFVNVAPPAEPNDSRSTDTDPNNSFGADEAMRISPPFNPSLLSVGPRTSSDRDIPSLDEQRPSRPQPDGAPRQLRHVVDGPGRSRQVVESYDEALDQLTQELLEMLEKSDVLVVWLFDRSGSMEDDRAEVLRLLNRVYGELESHQSASQFSLYTAVTSFSTKLWPSQLRHPSKDCEKVLEAMRLIGSDDTGVENISSAVLEALTSYGPLVSRRRQLVLVLVTDEAGEPDDHYRNLEFAVQEARTARCRIYVFGREAVFGHQVAKVRWPDPVTGDEREVAITRGPDSPAVELGRMSVMPAGVAGLASGFQIAPVEQLLTDGFGERKDAHPSGFGPYAQCRLANETGGIFFLLPGEEADLLRRTDHRYELKAVRGYEPFLGTLSEYKAQLQSRPFRRLIATIVQDLNPYDPEKPDWIKLRNSFSAKPPDFLAEAPVAIANARLLGTYLQQGMWQLEQAERYRVDEPLRWQANYNLLRAQLATYAVRAHQYMVSIQQFLANPPVVSMDQDRPRGQLSHWDVVLRKGTIGGSAVDNAVARATELMREVTKRHPGTPWAARANDELNLGFGITLRPRWARADQKPQPELVVPKL